MNDPNGKGKEKSLSRVESSIPFMHHDPGDLRSLIFTLIKKCTARNNSYLISGFD